MSSQEELEEVQEVFDLFDFWDGRDGLIDAAKVGDLLRKYTQYTLQQFLAMYRQMDDVKEWGTFREFQEAFRFFDREGQGYISAAECRHLLTAMGERLTDEDVDQIMTLTGVEVDLQGNIKYADFIRKVMAGPPDDDK